MDSTRENSETAPPPLLPVTRTLNVAALGLGLFTATALGVLFFFDPAHHSFYPPCLFHQITGLNCPGCGSTRAMHELLHGHVLAALHSNALLLGSLPLVIGLTARFWIRHRRGQPTLDADFQPKWLWIFLGVLAVFTVLRNLPEFAWLSP